MHFSIVGRRRVYFLNMIHSLLRLTTDCTLSCEALDKKGLCNFTLARGIGYHPVTFVLFRCFKHWCRSLQKVRV